MGTSATIIGTIHGPGLPGPITVAGGSTEPGSNVLPPREVASQVFMVVDDNVIEIGRTQGFTRIVEPKMKKTDPPPIPPHTSKGQGGRRWSISKQAS